jgi:hypothetical protein
VDTSKTFEWYKPKHLKHTDIFHHFFAKDNISSIKYNQDVQYDPGFQFINYKTINYNAILPFVNKYFKLNNEIDGIVTNIETKYKLDYDNICVLFYRGNDKSKETKLSSYNDYIKYANEILKKNKNIRFLIQSDETEFIKTILNKFNNSFYFKDEIRHMKKRNGTVDKVFNKSNYKFSKKYLAITYIMSRCKYIVCGSGNCSIWIMFYRNNANNVYQFLNGKWFT